MYWNLNVDNFLTKLWIYIIYYLLTGCMRKDGDHFQVLAPFFWLEYSDFPPSKLQNCSVSDPSFLWSRPRIWLYSIESHRRKLKPKKCIIEYTKLHIKKFSWWLASLNNGSSAIIILNIPDGIQEKCQKTTTAANISQWSCDSTDWFQRTL